MMTIWIAVMMTCSNSYLVPEIKCTWDATEEMWGSKAACEKEATKSFKKKFICIDVEVEMKGLPKGIKVIVE